MEKIKTLKAIAVNGDTVKIQPTVTQKDNVYKMSFQVLEDSFIKEVMILSEEHSFPHDATFYGDGYSKLSQYGGTVANIKSSTHFSDRSHYHMPQTEGFSTAYNYIYINNDGHYFLMGATSCKHFRTEFRINAKIISIVQSLENLFYKKGEVVELESIAILDGDDVNQLLDFFSNKIQDNHTTKKYGESPFGWCSWYCIGPDISEKKIFENLKVIKEKVPELKYIQIDDGFQPFMGDWLEVSDKFTRPMQSICNDIKSSGFEPAIWLAPFIASKGSRLLAEHPDYFVKDLEGNPLCSQSVTFPGWRDTPWYFLDTTNPDARKYIFDVVRTIYKEWKVKYFKLDANVWGALPFGVRYDKKATCIDSYRLGMETIWEATGSDAYILGCNAPMWPSLGLVSGMRVTGDIERSIGSVKQLSTECFRRNWMNNTIWENDPDCIILSDTIARKYKKLSKFIKAKARAKFFKYCSIYVRASGGIVLSGDYVDDYTSKDIDLLNRIIQLPRHAAKFDEQQEYGVIKYDNVLEYCIFNKQNNSRIFSIPVPSGKIAVDMYTLTTLNVEGLTLDIKLKKNDSCWIIVK